MKHRAGMCCAPPRALSHPLWWAALALLVANDHVLKGAGLLPESLTGKLSDFAGMIVAPPLLGALIGASVGAIRPVDVRPALSGIARIEVALAHAALHVTRRSEWQFARPDSPLAWGRYTHAPAPLPG